MNFDDDDDRDALAGEYVIGLLSESDRAELESAMAERPDLAMAVARWQDALLPLTRRVEPVDPSPALWQRIESALSTSETGAPSAAGAASSPGASSAPGAPAATGTASATTTRPTIEPPARRTPPRNVAPPWSRPVPARPSIWNSLRVWRSISALSAAAAVLMASVVVLRPPEVQVYYAVLKSPNEQVGWLVQAKSAGTFRLVPLDSNTAVPAGKALELWTKAEGASGPTSLGLITPGQVVEFSVDRLPALGSNQLFEISVEPETGSPIGRPTGPVLFIGKTEGI